MKVTVWDLLSLITMLVTIGLVAIFITIFSDPYSNYNLLPPPTIPPTIQLPSATPTQRALPSTWTPTGLIPTTSFELLASSTALPSGTSFVLPTLTATATSTNTATATVTITSTPAPTNTLKPTRTATTRPTRTRTPKPPTVVPPTDVPPTDIPPTDVPPTDIPPTEAPSETATSETSG